MRNVKCDHAVETPKLHPASHVLSIGNLVIEMCATCWNSVFGQVLSTEIRYLLSAQTVKLNPPPEVKKGKGQTP